MTVVPLPGALSIAIVPAIASISFLTILIPRPVPSTPESVEELSKLISEDDSIYEEDADE